MKYLYGIFRLFKCPHKYEILSGAALTRKKSKKVYAYKYFLKCSKCGKIKKTIKKN